jgi:hypothetical protein
METVGQKQNHMRASERAQEVPPVVTPDSLEVISAPAGARTDRVAQAVGVLLILAGISLIAFVLLQAFHLYQDPSGGITGGKAVNPSTEQIGAQLIGLVVKIALLFLGSITGSLIANKGINLYFSALRRE